MRKVLHGSVWFQPEEADKVKHLMLLQCSATRSAYQFLQRTKNTTNDLKVHVKQHYMAGLNQRYVSDACTLATGIKQPHAIFGGKKSWRDVAHGRISKLTWQTKRNSMLYSCGDRTKKGNSNIRIMRDKLLVNDPSGRGLWIEGQLHIPAKFRKEFDSSCYDVRLKLKPDGSMQVTATWETPTPRIGTGNPTRGTIGIDTNPDGCGLVETSPDGNLLHHQYERAERIQFASANKRDHDVRELAIRVVDHAISTGKPLVVEHLSFKKGKPRGYKKFRRMRHNFLHKKILDAVRSRATRAGVEVIEVEPAFTSILGKLKYQAMYSLNRHTAAALVIARRGAGFKERQDFTDTLKGKRGEGPTLEGRGHSHTLSRKAWSWLQDCFLKPKPVSLTGTPLVPGLKLGIEGSVGENPADESCPTTGRTRRQNPIKDPSLTGMKGP